MEVGFGSGLLIAIILYRIAVLAAIFQDWDKLDKLLGASEIRPIQQTTRPIRRAFNNLDISQYDKYFTN